MLPHIHSIHFTTTLTLRIDDCLHHSLIIGSIVRCTRHVLEKHKRKHKHQHQHYSEFYATLQNNTELSRSCVLIHLQPHNNISPHTNMFSRIIARAPRAFVRYNSSSSASRTSRIVEMAGQVEKPSTYSYQQDLALSECTVTCCDRSLTSFRRH